MVITIKITFLCAQYILLMFLSLNIHGNSKTSRYPIPTLSDDSLCCHATTCQPVTADAMNCFLQGLFFLTACSYNARRRHNTQGGRRYLPPSAYTSSQGERVSHASLTGIAGLFCSLDLPATGWCDILVTDASHVRLWLWMSSNTLLLF